MTVVFNRDVNARQKDYTHLKPGEVLVSKIFYSIQGEGPFTGHPCVFVRLAGCNLGNKDSCPWCDSDFRLRKGNIYTPEAVLYAARQLYQDRLNKLMILTGGEPFLQSNSIDLMDAFLNTGWTVQTETNGYFWNEQFQKFADMNSFFPLFIVVSPKVNMRKVYPDINKDLLKYSTCLKILVEDKLDSPYQCIPQFAHNYTKDLHKPVYVSGITVYKKEPHPNEEISSFFSDCIDQEKSIRNYKYAKQLAMHYGYRLSLQSHLFVDAE